MGRFTLHSETLPLVDETLSLFPNLDLSNVRIVGVQHILNTTVSMIKSLIRYGLNPANVYLIGKCYSTHKESLDELVEMGVYVSKESLYYNSYTSFDRSFEISVRSLVIRFVNNLFLNDNDKNPVIILDDGGTCINFFASRCKPIRGLVGVEQTTDGLNRMKSNINFPVLNVARNNIKLTLESPLIAGAISEKTLKKLSINDCTPKNCLVIGGFGAVGAEIIKTMSCYFPKITNFDLRKQSYSPVCFQDMLSGHDLIIGCTGTTSIPHYMFKHLTPETILVSASSSDREFDAPILRQLTKMNDDCHADLMIQNKLLLNSGFPINFDGMEENIDPLKIQITTSLISLAIAQASSFSSLELSRKGILELKEEATNFIEERFLNNYT